MTSVQTASPPERDPRDASAEPAASAALAGLAAPFSHSLAQQALAKEAPRLQADHGPASDRGQSLAHARAQRLDPAESPRQRPAPARADGLSPAPRSHPSAGRPPVQSATQSASPASPARTSQAHAPAAPEATPRAHAAIPATPSVAAPSAAARAPRPAALLQALGSSTGPRLVLAHGARASAPGPKAVAPGAPAARRAQPDEFAAQLSRGLAAAFRQHGGTVTLRLQPDALGEVRIRLDLSPGQVAASFEAGSDEARQLLTHHLADLRSALEARGLEVAGLDVAHNPRLEPSAVQDGRHSGGAHDAGSSGADSSGADSGAHGRGPDPGRHSQDAMVPIVRTPEGGATTPTAETSEVLGGGPCLRLDAVA